VISFPSPCVAVPPKTSLAILTFATCLVVLASTLRVQIHIPERLSREEREQYEQLRALKRGCAKPFTTPRATSHTDTRHPSAQPGLKSWLAACWNRIDKTVRQWLQGA
jgi:hypothetical protein